MRFELFVSTKHASSNHIKKCTKTYRKHFQHHPHRIVDNRNDLVSYVDTNNLRRENAHDNIDIRDDLKKKNTINIISAFVYQTNLDDCDHRRHRLDDALPKV